MWVQAESDARLEPEVGLTESELSHAEWTVISLPGSSSCPVFFFFCPITCVYVNDVAPRTAKSPRQGETEVAKKPDIFRNKNSRLFGSTAVAVAPFYKGQNICRTKRLIFLPESEK